MESNANQLVARVISNAYRKIIEMMISLKLISHNLVIHTITKLLQWQKYHSIIAIILYFRCSEDFIMLSNSSLNKSVTISTCCSLIKKFIAWMQISKDVYIYKKI